MLIALLTAFFFAVSITCARRSTALIGPWLANALRMSFAVSVMALLTWQFAPVELSTRAAQRLYFSGLAGFALGDITIFIALKRLGSRQASLISLCLAPAFGLVGDWLLLGTALQGWQMLACVIILAGVGLSQMPGADEKFTWDGRGVLAAVISGLGMGWGATLSRFAKAAAQADGTSLTSYNETLLRLLPAWPVVVLMAWLMRGRVQTAQPVLLSQSLPKAAPWIIANATFGTVLGVTCFQWALGHASSALVLSITATTPLFVMPLAVWLEGDQLSRSSILGAVIAVSGVILLRTSG